MNIRTSRNHVVDLVFTLALFCVFSASALMVVIMGADVYQSAVSESNTYHTRSTALTYLSEKIRQNDTSGNVSVGSFQGHQALVIRQEIEDTAYITYIYLYEGRQLKELYTKEGAVVPDGSGQEILTVNDFTVEELGQNLYRFTVEDTGGSKSSLLIGTHSS